MAARGFFNEFIVLTFNEFYFVLQFLKRVNKTNMYDDYDNVSSIDRSECECECDVIFFFLCLDV